MKLTQEQVNSYREAFVKLEQGQSLNFDDRQNLIFFIDTLATSFGDTLLVIASISKLNPFSDEGKKILEILDTITYVVDGKALTRSVMDRINNLKKKMEEDLNGK